jgi:hypothetical protein
MVSTILFIHANLQHGISASGIIPRTVSSKGINMALIQDRGIARTVFRT